MAFGLGSIAGGAASPFGGGEPLGGQDSSGLFGQVLKRNPNLVPDTSNKAGWWNQPVGGQQPNQPSPWDKQPSTPDTPPFQQTPPVGDDQYKLNNPPPWMNDWGKPDPNLEHTMPVPSGQGDFPQYQPMPIDFGQLLASLTGQTPDPNQMHLMNQGQHRGWMNQPLNLPPGHGGVPPGFANGLDVFKNGSIQNGQLQRRGPFGQQQPQMPQFDMKKAEEMRRKQDGTLKTDANGNPTWDPKIYDRQGLSPEQAKQLGLQSNGWGGWAPYDPNRGVTYFN